MAKNLSREEKIEKYQIKTHELVRHNLIYPRRGGTSRLSQGGMQEDVYYSLNEFMDEIRHFLESHRIEDCQVGYEMEYDYESTRIAGIFLIACDVPRSADVIDQEIKDAEDREARRKNDAKESKKRREDLERKTYEKLKKKFEKK